MIKTQVKDVPYFLAVRPSFYVTPTRRSVVYPVHITLNSLILPLGS